MQLIMRMHVLSKHLQAAEHISLQTITQAVQQIQNQPHAGSKVLRPLLLMTIQTLLLRVQAFTPSSQQIDLHPAEPLLVQH